MAESHVLSALKDKRAELSGYIQDLESRARKMKMRLVHLDATIAMYAADFDPKTVRPRVPRPLKGPFERGELARLCLEELRQAKTPPTVEAMASRLIASKGFPATDAALHYSVCHSLTAHLRVLKMRKVVKSHRNEARELVWTVV